MRVLGSVILFYSSHLRQWFCLVKASFESLNRGTVSASDVEPDKMASAMHHGQWNPEAV